MVYIIKCFMAVLCGFFFQLPFLGTQTFKVQVTGLWTLICWLLLLRWLELLDSIHNVVNLVPQHHFFLSTQFHSFPLCLVLSHCLCLIFPRSVTPCHCSYVSRWAYVSHYKEYTYMITSFHIKVSLPWQTYMIKPSHFWPFSLVPLKQIDWPSRFSSLA